MPQNIHTLSHLKYRPDIDGLRAIAVLSVVLFHAFPSIFSGGYIGVDIFFVISGYLISKIIFENLHTQSFNFLNFYARRINRIFPSLLVVLLACYVLGWFILFPEEYKQLGKHIVAGAGFLSNIVLWGEKGYFDNASETKPLLHLWSLGIEEQFYLIWPPLVYFSWKKRINLFYLIAIILIASLILNIVEIHSNPIATFYSPQTRFWELLCGSAIAYINLSFIKQPQTNQAIWTINYYKFSENIIACNLQALIGLSLLILGIFFIPKAVFFPGLWALIPTLGAVFIIQSHKSLINRFFLSNKLLVWFGLISFPLYLWHWPLLSFLRIMEGETVDPKIRFYAVLLSIFLAWFTYKFIEKPIRFNVQNKYKPLILSFLMVLMGSIGLFDYLQDGFPGRYPKNSTVSSTQNSEIEQIKSEHNLLASTKATFTNPPQGRDIDPLREQPLESLRKEFELNADIGRSPNAKVMLIGDSHAAHLIPGLKREFGSLVGDYTSAGCIPFYGVDRFDAQHPQGSCLKMMKDFFNVFEQSPSMTTIILSSMGPVYLLGEEFNGLESGRTVGLGVTYEGNVHITDRWEAYREGMKNTLERLTSKDKKVIFVIDVPELGFNPELCLSNRPLSIGSKKKTPCAVSRKDYDQRVLRYKSLVYEIARKYPAVTVVDPTNAFCDDEWCWAIKDGNLLYRDPDHLSLYGSIYTVKYLSPIIRRSLKNSEVKN